MSEKALRARATRPTTANLSRPQIMDPSWSLNIDMTEIKLSTLEEVEALLTKPRRAAKKRAEDILVKKARRVVPGPIDAKRPAKVTAMDILGQEVTGQVPSPCKTCTKNDEPERFHSHPKTASTRSKIMEETTHRKAVTKPVALKFRSGKSKEKSKLQLEIKDSPSLVPTSKILPAKFSICKVSSPCSKCGKQVVSNLLEAHERICRGKADVVLAPVNLKMAYDQTLLFCKKCGKTFGTDEDLLRLHIESCDIKWTDLDGQLENERLGSAVNNEEQYEQYKEKLVPCPVCKRKFLPNRIETHESACRKVHHTTRLK
ncbi:hypothetical protein GE061_000705 [Apolygus lucorum]|uniref:C2HC/C3H-type domain-containing protein n=1 Tax=Apolygus lucorum TaxID=248454 RepID=A0A8S9Y699_APOLU|nr:hypothetical protein GE061_000705 [Apolygus lucorum]